MSLLLVNCTSDKPAPEGIVTDCLPPKYSSLHKLFKDTLFDSLYVTSDWRVDSTGFPTDFPFKGIAMDSVHVSYLPYEARYHYKWNEDYGASCKFKIDSHRIALIIRIPSEYVSTAVNLFIYDLRKDSMTITGRLADSRGDAGEASIFDSYIFQDKNKTFHILTYFFGEYNHTASDVDSSGIVERWNYYGLYNINGNSVDTISSDSAEITRRYPMLVKKLEGRYKR